METPRTPLDRLNCIRGLACLLEPQRELAVKPRVGRAVSMTVEGSRRFQSPKRLGMPMVVGSTVLHPPYTFQHPQLYGQARSPEARRRAPAF
jgi:hypothetical protein